MNHAMDEAHVEPAARASPTGLFRSLTQLLSTIVGLVQTRLELLATEVQEEVHRASELLLWSFIAILGAGTALFFIGLTIIIAFWDTNRLTAAIIVTAAYLLVPLVCFLTIRHKMRTRPRLLDATRAELKKDREQLEARL